MILYHGSNVQIERIELEKSKPFKDFGRGFYLSPDRQQAEKMAIFRSKVLGNAPIVTEFSFDERKLFDGTLRFLSFDSYTEEWAKFVLKNREESDSFQDDYDVIYGPIANDRIGLQIHKLMEKSIDMQEFLHRIKYFKGVTYQYFFGTDCAISYLKKL
ncbi:MAG: DUF3990 domain-containing protein [Paludibacteraceae bacterium]|nr:DUF3990 domain-containing protein [Paludibacteraceae bacterium]